MNTIGNVCRRKEAFLWQQAFLGGRPEKSGSGNIDTANDLPSLCPFSGSNRSSQLNSLEILIFKVNYLLAGIVMI